MGKIGKYAQDYGLDPSKSDDRKTVNNITDEIYNFSDEVRTGRWRGYDGDVDFSIKGDDVVVSRRSVFITILKGRVSSGMVKNARKRKI